MKPFGKDITFVLILILVSSSCFQLNDFPILRSLMSLLSKLVFAISFFVFATKFKQSDNTLLGLIAIYLIYLLVISVRNSTDYVRLVPIFMKLTGVIMLCGPYIISHNKDIILILSRAFRLIVLLNFFQMIFLPGMMGEGYLIASNYNQFGSIMCITMLLSYLEYNYTRRYIKMLMTFLVCFLTVAIPGSMTATLCVLLMMTFFLVKTNLKIKKLVALSVLLFTFLFLIIFVVAQSFQLSTDIQIGNVVEKLGKDVTFSGRTVIWIYSLATILTSPITGSGFYDKDWALVNVNGVNSHNLILDVTIQGGIILLLYFIFIVGYVIKNVRHSPNKYIQISLIFTLYVFMLMSQMEVYNYFMIFILLFVLIIGSKFDNSSQFISRVDKRISEN